MSSYFDEPDENDDGAFVTMRFNSILSEDHPAMLIKKFISILNLSSFEEKYNVGPSKKGRPPKGIKMMLGLILYAVYSRIYSAHQIDYASYNYSDFWIFTHKNRISHDKISDFINLHENEIYEVFLETIILADKNKLLDFDTQFQDGFFIKANASKLKNRKRKSLNKKQQRAKEALEQIFEKLKNVEEDKETKKKREDLEKKLNKITELQEELNKKIKEKQNHNKKGKIDEEKVLVNETDSDSSLMKMKDKSYANAYLKVTAVDSKADIVIGSVLEGYSDEPHTTVKLFDEANKNCDGLGEYDTVCFDSGFNTMGTSVAFESKEIKVIAPTKDHEHKKRNPNKDFINFEYDEDKHELTCSEGNVLTQKDKNFDSAKGTLLYKFSNKEGCKNCKKLDRCTISKSGYRTVKVDSRYSCQQRVLERYKSEEGQKIYKKRSHSAETYQGDLKKNGKFERFYRRGLPKVKVDSIMHDIVWNLRRIINSRGTKVIMT